jgi:hypothetical protein
MMIASPPARRRDGVFSPKEIPVKVYSGLAPLVRQGHLDGALDKIPEPAFATITSKRLNHRSVVSMTPGLHSLRRTSRCIRRRRRRHLRSCPQPRRRLVHVGYHDFRASRATVAVRAAPVPGRWEVPLARILVDGALLSGGTTRVGLPDDPFYFVDTDAIKLGDLRLRHAIARQRADTPELRCGYRAGFAPGRLPPSCRFRPGRLFYLCRFHWYRRQNSEDTRLAPRLRLGGWNGVFGRRCRVDRPGVRPRLKQVFRILSRSVDLFTIGASVRRPFARQALLR